MAAINEINIAGPKLSEDECGYLRNKKGKFVTKKTVAKSVCSANKLIQARTDTSKWWHIKISGNHIGKIKQESGHHYAVKRIPERHLVFSFFADYTCISYSNPMKSVISASKSSCSCCHQV